MSGPLDGLDWSPLELSGNPVPGDPGGVRKLSGQLTSLANDVGLQNRLLRSVGNNSESVWEGPAADKFHPAIKDLPGSLDKLVSSYGSASGALEEYWPSLHAAQEMALEALHEARLAQADIRSAQGKVSSARRAVTSSGQTYNLAVAAQRPVPGAPPPSAHAAAKAEAATHNAHTAYSRSQSDLSDAQASLTSANGRLSSAKAKAATARSNGSAAASRLAGKINSAAKVAPAKPHHSFWGGLWDDVTSVVSGGVHWVEHHAKDIETVAAGVALGPAGLLLTGEGRKWLSDAGHAVEHGLHEALPVLDVASGVLGVVSLGLAVAGFIPGVGEVADIANEGVTLLKTGVDGARLAGGEESAAEDLAGDGLALISGGESRIFTSLGDAAKAGDEVTTATEDVSELRGTVNVLKAGKAEASELADAAGDDATLAEYEAEFAGEDPATAPDAVLLRGVQSNAAERASALGEKATAKEGELSKAQSSLREAKGAQAEIGERTTVKEFTGQGPLSRLAKNGFAKTVNEGGVSKASDLVKPKTWANYYKGWGGHALPARLASASLGANEVKNGITELPKNIHKIVAPGAPEE